MRLPFICIFILVVIIFGTLSLQAQGIKKEIESLENDFKTFKYRRVIEKGDFLLSDPYTNKEDSLLIYQYMLSAAYALNDTTTAKKTIKEILKCEPDFSLNPKNISPKIIEFFNYIKSQLSQRQNNDSQKPPVTTIKQTTVKDIVKPEHALASILFPGSGHLLTDHKKEGYIFSSISAVLLASTIYTAIATDNNREKYMKARGNADYNQLYDKYNTSYKTRNVLLVVYGLWNMYALYDLHNKHNISVSVSGNKDAISLNFSKIW